MKINEITSKKKKPIKESTEVAEIGRAMMDMAIKQKDDEVSNNMSTLGAALTRFGTVSGPQDIKGVVKQTGLQPETIQQYMKAAKQYVEKHGPVRSGSDQGGDDDYGDDDYGDDDQEVDIGDDDMDYVDGDQGNERR